MRWSSLSLGFLFAGLGLSGCVVNAGSSRPVLDVQWQPAGGSCAALGASSVHISIDSGGVAFADSTVPCDRLHQLIAVDEGIFTVQVDGISPSGAVVATTVPQSFTARAGFTQPTGLLSLQPVSTGTGNITASWTLLGESAASACAKRGIQTISLSVLDDAKAKILVTGQASCSAGSATITGIPPGTRWLQIDGLNAQGAVAFGNSPLTGPLDVTADTTTLISTPIDLMDLNQTGGSIALAWTINGLPPAQVCTQLGIQTVSVAVLDDQAAKTVATAQAACATGSLKIPNVPVGTHYLQLDGLGAGTTVNFGSSSPYGPITVTTGVITTVSNTLDLVDLRSQVSLNWSFSGGGSCQAHAINTVRLQVLDGKGNVLVPFNDASASKPCDLNTSDTPALRFIDLQSVTPTCTMPAGAKNLVVCNVLYDTLTINAQALDANGTVQFGGSLALNKIPVGKHSPISTDLILAPCSAPGAICPK
jgi:hypothetical protein